MQTIRRFSISQELRERFLSAKSVFVLTGAGVSAESGVPTFRGGGNTAVWKGMPFDVISSAGLGQRDLPAGLEMVLLPRGFAPGVEPQLFPPGGGLLRRRVCGFSAVVSDIS